MYFIPIGGSNALGTLGYVRAAEEILAQCEEQDLQFKEVIVASGSGGTHAGLALGFHQKSAPFSLQGINVSAPNAVQVPKVENVLKRAAELLGGMDVPAGLITCDDRYVGDGYTLPTAEMVEAVQLLARTEGILLDAVYTGKVMAGLINFVRQGKYTKDDNVLFIHTGGAMSLSAFGHVFK